MASNGTNRHILMIHKGDLILHDIEWVPVPLEALGKMKDRTRAWPDGMRQVADALLRDCEGYSVEIDADGKWTLHRNLRETT